MSPHPRMRVIAQIFPTSRRFRSLDSRRKTGAAGEALVGDNAVSAAV